MKIYLHYLTDQQVKTSEVEVYELESVQVQYGKTNIPTATIQLKAPDWRSGSQMQLRSSGTVEAIFNTLEKLVE